MRQPHYDTCSIVWPSRAKRSLLEVESWRTRSSESNYCTSTTSIDSRSSITYFHYTLDHSYKSLIEDIISCAEQSSASELVRIFDRHFRLLHSIELGNTFIAVDKISVGPIFGYESYANRIVTLSTELHFFQPTFRICPPIVVDHS